MIERKVLKERGKASFKANYWRCVLVALILVMVIGTGAGYSATKTYEAENTEVTVESNMDDRTTFFAVGMLLAMLSVGGTFVCLFNVLVLNPLEVGCRHFFSSNSEAKAKVGKIGRGFSPYYWRTVGAILLRDIYLLLWTFLFIIPGIIKAFSYAMVPYIIAEDDDISPKQAITLSRKMMNGHKWEYFKLHFSFIGWFILSVATCGILGTFYVNPYVFSTDAQFYLALRDEAEGRV